MKNLRVTLYIALSFIYFVPFFLVYKMVNINFQLMMGLVFWSMTSLAILLYFFIFLEKKMKREVSAQVSSRIGQYEKRFFLHQKTEHSSINLEKIGELIRELEDQHKNQKQLQLEVEKLKGLNLHQERDFAQLNEDLHNQLDKKETILGEYRHTLREQRKIIEKKQEEVNVLQIRVNDLKYELENLLKLKKDPSPSHSFIESSKENIAEGENLLYKSSLADSVQVKLDRYVKMATRLNGAKHFAGKDSKYSELSLGSLIIDQRRLFDRLQNEESSAILVYSREEGQIVFVNPCIKELLGWSPERFVKDFSFLIQKGQDEWNEALEDVKLDHQKSIRLLLKTRSGKDTLVTCHLKEVSEGVFKSYVLGILSSTSSP